MGFSGSQIDLNKPFEKYHKDPISIGPEKIKFFLSR